MFDLSLKNYLEIAIEECEQDGYAQLTLLPQTQEGGNWNLVVNWDSYQLMIDIEGDQSHYADFSNFEDLVRCCERIYDGSINPIVD